MRKLLSIAVALVAIGCNAISTATQAPSPGASDCPTPATDLIDWCTRWKSVGYELYITRAEFSYESESAPISEAEWLVAADADVRIEVFGSNSVFTWKAIDGPSMWWSDGLVHVKGLDSEAQIAEIAAFAQTLGARLIGDDNETYDTSGRPHPWTGS